MYFFFLHLHLGEGYVSKDEQLLSTFFEKSPLINFANKLCSYLIQTHI